MWGKRGAGDPQRPPLSPSGAVTLCPRRGQRSPAPPATAWDRPCSPQPGQGQECRGLRGLWGLHPAVLLLHTRLGRSEQPPSTAGLPDNLERDGGAWESQYESHVGSQPAAGNAARGYGSPRAGGRLGKLPLPPAFASEPRREAGPGAVLHVEESAARVGLRGVSGAVRRRVGLRAAVGSRGAVGCGRGRSAQRSLAARGRCWLRRGGEGPRWEGGDGRDAAPPGPALRPFPK